MLAAKAGGYLSLRNRQTQPQFAGNTEIIT
jgi:hypothetical protein